MPTSVHLTPIRLTDIPLPKRMAAARAAAHTCHTQNEALELLAAAISPSAQTYWVSEQAARAA